MDVTPQSIMDVKFREKVRGYHPADVDAFVSEVAAAVGELQQRVARAEARVRELESRGGGGTGGGTSETEETLRRTLVLAQRTADLAVQEAREEASRMLSDAHAQRDGVLAEVAEMRARLYAESEAEIRDHRERLYSLRDALVADVQALESHLSRERERLRIYFSDQLRRVEEGEPGTAPMPATHAPDQEVAYADVPPAGPVAAEVSAEMSVPDDEPPGVDVPMAPADEEHDPFMAELRRAATDDEPLGPRDAPHDVEDDDEGFDLFAPGEDESGRFGARRRRRR